MSLEKRFEASQRKLQRSREDGDVAKSRDFTGSISLAFGFYCLFFYLSPWAKLLEFAQRTFLHEHYFAEEFVLLYLLESVGNILALLWLPFSAVFFSTIAMEALQVGVAWSAKPLKWKWSRLNLCNGLKRLIGAPISDGEEPTIKEKVFEAIKLLLALIVSGILMGGMLILSFGKLVFHGFESVAETVWICVVLAKAIVFCGLLVYLVLGAADFVLAKRRRYRRLRMDDQEFKKELRENEGNPEVKSMRKQLHHEVIHQALIDGVRRAKVIVTN